MAPVDPAGRSSRDPAMSGRGMIGGMIANDEALSRIPIRVRDEMTILSMARRLRFVGAIKVVGGLLTVFILPVAIISIGAVLNASRTPASGAPSITVMVGDRTEPVPLDRLSRLVSENRITFAALGAFALILSVAGTVLGFVLDQAADDFDRVARTDVADQDDIAAGVARLNAYFKVSILLGVAAVLVTIAAAIGLAARLSAGTLKEDPPTRSRRAAWLGPTSVRRGTRNLAIGPTAGLSSRRDGPAPTGPEDLRPTGVSVGFPAAWRGSDRTGRPQDGLRPAHGPAKRSAGRSRRPSLAFQADA